MRIHTGTLAPYEALAAVYDRWTADNDYTKWADHLASLLAADGCRVRVLDVCCGTGSVTRLLHQRGFTVDGVDGSAGMLDRARDRVPADVNLFEVHLPAPLPVADGRYDAAVCCFDSINYFAPAQLPDLFRAVARTLRPGGRFVFDVNTRHKLEAVFGDSHYGDDREQDGYAYVWRNRYRPADHRCDFAITLFTAGDGGWHRQTEAHSQWWFSHEEILDAAAAAGLTVTSVTDDYGDQPPGPDTLRETWTLLRTVTSAPGRA